ncbi:MAG TPA: hypothetical protein VIH97_10310 [Candidatus Acidoferrales bacterium]|jgi:hypothetical protein
MSRIVKKRKMPALIHSLASSSGLAVVIAGVLAAGSPLRTPFSVAAAANKLAPLVADKGKFRIMVNGQAVGKEEFEITPAGADWTAHAISEIQTPQGVTKVNGTLTVHPDGTPVHYDWSTQGLKKASSTIAFSGTGASVELHIEGARPFAQDFTFNTPLVSVLDNNLYHQYELLARLYNREAKGSQTFSVLVPQEMTPGSVTVDSLGKQDAGGKQLEELRVRTEDNEIDLYLDGQKLMRLVAPAANAEIVRDEK